MGTSRHGVDGFRVSTAEALGAQRVAVAAAADCQLDITTAADVGPLALMCDDMDRLRGWVRGTLGPLAAADEAAARLRGTLEVFLSTGGNFVQTGRLLSLHRNTVHYRITKAEKLLGGDVADRRLVLELALLACRMLGAPVLSGAAV
jgi:DNA-binding PucR family transcriptional regulator